MYEEHYISAVPENKGNCEAEIKGLVGEIKEYLCNNQLTVILERAFGTSKGLLLLDSILGERGFMDDVAPTLLVSPKGIHGELAAIQIHAAKHISLWETVQYGGKPVGRILKVNAKKIITLSHITGDKNCDNFKEAVSMFHTITAILNHYNADITKVARTWMWLDNILGWYHDFNKARNNCFKEQMLICDSGVNKLPASTGIGVKPYSNAACTCELVAIADAEDKIEYLEKVRNQNSAFDYGSAFSRAAKVNLISSPTIYISGTAAIAKTGETLHVNNPEAQIDATIKNIDTLLADMNCTHDDIVQCIAYCKNTVIEKMIHENRTDYNWIIDTIIADICRDNLLFEIEATCILHA
jgi:enamine deaminase RidA (YjgF/YER057c/UK114 family)